jgi:type VI secretion system protein VasG
MASRATEVDIRYRMLDAIFNQSLLLEISRELLTRLMECATTKKVEVTVQDGTFAYHYE